MKFNLEKLEKLRFQKNDSEIFLRIISEYFPGQLKPGIYSELIRIMCRAGGCGRVVLAVEEMRGGQSP